MEIRQLKRIGVLRTGLAAGLLALAAGRSLAGPALDTALEWDPAVWPGAPATRQAGTPREGLESALSGAGLDAPWLVPGGGAGQLSAHFVSRVHQLGSSSPVHWRAGFGWRDGPRRTWSFDGSMVAVATGRSELYASVERRHWGPGWVGSLILDASAPALPAVGWRRSEQPPLASDGPWIRLLGPWSADVFIGRLEGHSEPRRPLLVGTRFQFRPAAGLAVGLSRTMQWGGEGRDESLRSLLGGLLGRDNLGAAGVTRANEPGNQLAGIDWHWQSAAPGAPSWYGQVVGEDEAGLLPSKNMILLGADASLSIAGRRARVFIEAADTTAGTLRPDPAFGAAYRHHAFRQGYTHAGALLGHPMGGDARLASLGIVLRSHPWGWMATASAGRAAATAQRFAAGPVRALNVSLHGDVAGGGRVGAGLWWSSDRHARRGAAQVWWQHCR
jgi:Capsule assembly protein Wzi